MRMQAHMLFQLSACCMLPYTDDRLGRKQDRRIRTQHRCQQSIWDERAGCIPVADILVCLVEVLHVLLHNVARGDVSAATKPPLAGDAVPLLRLKVPAFHEGVLGHLVDHRQWNRNNKAAQYQPRVLHTTQQTP